MNLSDLRREIDGVDERLIPLFIERMALSDRVAAYKRENGLPTQSAAREAEILSSVRARAGEEYGSYAEALYQTILALSRARQDEVNARQENPADRNS